MFNFKKIIFWNCIINGEMWERDENLKFYQSYTSYITTIFINNKSL